MVFPVPAEPETLAGTAIVSLHNRALGRMEEDSPFLPRIVECSLQLLPVAHDAEATLCVWVIKRIDACDNRAGNLRRPTGGQLQEGLRSLAWQVTGKIKDAVLIGGMDIGQPLGGDTVAQQLIV